MPSRPPLDTHAKALALNLDTSIYGSIAEIGAGQEVARWFFRVGAASGTVAQTICAYDKEVSDALYGEGARYVSKERVLAMLDCEYRQLLGRLEESRGAQSKFFAFAETAAARNYAGDNDQHAWIGLRFQAVAWGPPNDVILHAVLTAPTNAGQQEALGILGVNLIHAVHHFRSSPAEFLAALWEGLSLDRLEIDVLELHGPAFGKFDNRICGLTMLRLGMSRAIALDAAGNILDPASVLRKRPLIVNRGKYTQIEAFHTAMLVAAEEHLRGEGVALERDPVRVVELTLNPVTGEGPDDAAVLGRLAGLADLGVVLVTTFGDSYFLANHLRRHTKEPIRFVMGVSLIGQLLQERFYKELPGGLLEGLGKLLAANVRIYAYPMPRAEVEAVLGDYVRGCKIDEDCGLEVDADEIQPPPPIDHLWAYLRAAEWIVPIAKGAS